MLLLTGCRAGTLPSGRNVVTPFTRLSYQNSALLVIDTQNDFGSPGGSHTMPDFKSVIPNVERAIRIFRAAGRPVIHVVRLYPADGSNSDLCLRWQIANQGLRVVVPGTWGSELVPCTNPNGARLDPKLLMSGRVQQISDREFVCYKPRFNGFFRTPLSRFLRSQGIGSVVIVGITFPNCVRATQLGATDHDFRVALVPEACTQVYPDGLRAMQGEGVQLISLGALKESLAAARGMIDSPPIGVGISKP